MKTHRMETLAKYTDNVDLLSQLLDRLTCGQEVARRFLARMVADSDLMKASDLDDAEVRALEDPVWEDAVEGEEGKSAA